MEAMRKSWTDERLDHFSVRVDERFDRIESDIREMRSEMRGMTKTLGAMQRTMIHGVVALSAAMIAGFGGMAGLLAVVA